MTPELRDAPNKFKSEPGCPVDVISARTTLEIDAVGTPMACRIYIDYKNISSKPLSGVKFRVGYVDAEDQVRGTFHAPDGAVVEPGGTGHGKWRGDKVDPRTKSIMIRGLMARYSDGTMWESEKTQGGLIKPPPEQAAPAFGSGASGSPTFAGGSPGSFGAGSQLSPLDPSGSAARTGIPALPPQGELAPPVQSSEPSSPQAAPEAGSDKFSDGY